MTDIKEDNEGNVIPPVTTKSGRVLTQEDLDALADEAERGYDLSKWRPLGRPSLSGEQGHSPRIAFRASPELHEAASRRAKGEGKTISALAREAMEHYVSP